MKKKILYIHGLSSSGASSSAKSLQALFPDASVIAPDLPIDPKEALSMLLVLCEKEKPDVVIGTSMGGMFAQQMHGYKKILVNPAFHVSEFMRQNIGIQPFLNVRKDGIQQYEITTELCDAYLEIEKAQFLKITDFDHENTYALFGEKDNLVNCLDEYAKYYTHYSRFSGEHRLTFSDIKDTVAPLIDKIWDDIR